MKVWKYVLMIALLTTFVACSDSDDNEGNGGSNETVNYIGEHDPATITRGNATGIALKGFGWDNAAFNSTIMPSNATKESTAIKTLKDVAMNVAAATADRTIMGECGGSAQLILNINEAYGTFTGSFNCNSFCNDGVTIAGNINITGALNVVRDDLNEMTMEFISLEFISLEIVEETNILKIRGILKALFNGDNQVSTALYTMYTLDSSEKIYLYSAFIDTYSYQAGERRIETAGRFYHPDYGYVGVSTEYPIVTSTEYPRLWPSRGTLLFTADDETYVRITLSNPGTEDYTIEADTTGDGEVDYWYSTID